MSFYKHQSALGGDKEKEILVFVCIHAVVCGGGDFFQYRLNVKLHVHVHFTVASQFYVHINEE